MGILRHNVSVEIMPTCALCENQAWVWVEDTGTRPYLRAALCETHAPNGSGHYVIESLRAIRKMQEEMPESRLHAVARRRSRQ